MPQKRRGQTKRGRRVGTHMKSQMGKIMKPLTVRNHGDISKAIQRIMAGPITLVVVTAEWCGHCQELKPKYDNIMANSHHTIQNVAVDETMSQEFNDALTKSIPSAKPLEVSGFPSLLLVDSKGVVKDTVPNKVETIQTITENLGKSKTLNETTATAAAAEAAAAAAAEAAAAAAAAAEAATEAEGEAVPVIKVNTRNYKPLSKEPSILSTSSSPIMSILSPLPLSSKTGTANSNTGSMLNSNTGSMLNSNTVSPPPPEVESDTIIPSLASPAAAAAASVKQGGGSLYGSIASAAYKLAPPAVLLAAAAAMMKRKGSKGRKGNKGSKSNKGNKSNKSSRKTKRRRA